MTATWLDLGTEAPGACRARRPGLVENNSMGHEKVVGENVVVGESANDVAVVEAEVGGGTTAQKAAGIVDSPDILFKDLTDWSVVEPNGAAEYRFNDRDIVRAFADNNVFAYDFLVAHGLVWTKPVPDRGGMTRRASRLPGPCTRPSWIMCGFRPA